MVISAPPPDPIRIDPSAIVYEIEHRAHPRDPGQVTMHQQPEVDARDFDVGENPDQPRPFLNHAGDQGDPDSGLCCRQPSAGRVGGERRGAPFQRLTKPDDRS